MRHHRLQHIAEPPGHMRANRLTYVGMDHRGTFAPPETDGKMIGPERDQPLAKRRLRAEQIPDVPRLFRLKQPADRHLLAHHIRVRPPLANCRQPVRNRGSGQAQRGIRPFQLVRQPRLRIGRQRLLPPASQAKTDQRLCRAIFHGGHSTPTHPFPALTLM